jgi:two-component sensor histidine kinase
MFKKHFTDAQDACALAHAIVATIWEPIVVLDKEMRVIVASDSFYRSFNVSPADTEDKLLYELGHGEWDVPKLRSLLERIIPEQGSMKDYEVAHEFPALGHRIMCLNARPVAYRGGTDTAILLGIEDVTEQHTLQREKDGLLREKEVLLEELQHRVANSLQIIASIILMKARMVGSEESRAHLQDAHNRVLSVAAVQQQLRASGAVGPIEMAPYLKKLCETLESSIIGDSRPVSIKVVSDGACATSRQAESLGLISTELVMNALKRAFPTNKTDGRITVSYDVDATNWKLSVADNGIGRPDGVFTQPKTGLGTGIIKALAQQLGATVETIGNPKGTTVSVTHATFVVKGNRAA